LRVSVLFLLLSTLSRPSAINAQSYALSNRWSVAEGTVAIPSPTHPFLHGGDVTRGMAYNPVNGNVLVVTRTNPIAAVYILNGTTGAIVGTLAYDTNVIWGGNFPLNLIGAADDGAIYAANLTTDTTGANGPLRVYRWANESSAAQLVYSGDPTGGNTVGLQPRRLGDSLTVRGAGLNTQILLGSYNQSVYLLTTADGATFTHKRIITDAADQDTRWGLAWGSGDTFWAKQTGGNLKQFSMNLAASTASTVTSISALASVAGGPMAVDLTRNLIAIVETGTHTLRLYDISIPSSPMQMDTTRNFLSSTANGNGTGAVGLRDGKLFALESNNGLLAYTLNEVYLPPTVTTQPASVTLWQGAASWQFSVGVSGTRPFTYQWRLNGQAVAGETNPAVTVLNLGANNAGAYSVVVSNAYGSATSSSATLTATPSGASAQVTNVWNILPGERPYMTSGYKEYGMAYNPLSGNLIVLTRANPTNMLVALDAATGVEKNYIDCTGLTMTGTQPMNRVGVADDGAIYICNSTGNGSATAFVINGIGSDIPQTSDKWRAYTGSPGVGTLDNTNGWGGTFAVRGGGLNTEFLAGSSTLTAKSVAIFHPDTTYYFTPTLITVTNAPAGFARLGLSWGPGTNTFWAKAVSSLILVQYDLATQTGFVLKTYPMTGTRSVADTVTGVGYDATTGLLAGVYNGLTIRPVSIPVYDVRDLNAGPLLVDRELCTTYNTDIEYYGKVEFGGGYLFALALNNGIKAFKVNAGFVSLPVIVTQPVGGTWYNGTSPVLSVVADGATPVTYQWYLTNSPIAGATSSSLTLTNIQASQAGVYTVRVSTAGGDVYSAAATVSTVQVLDTAQTTNIWSLAPGSRSYLTINYNQYGMAYNPVTTNLLVSSLDGVTTIAVLDAPTGTEKGFMDVSTFAGGTKVLQKIDVADDGVVYAGNLTTTAGSTPFKLYRWSNDSASTLATVAYTGDPAATLNPNGGFGYTLKVRGAGAATEVLLAMTAGNVVSILKTTDGINFTPNEIKVTNAPTGFARLGIAFGEGNTFWAKTAAGQLYLVSYDLAAKSGTITKTYPTTQVPGSVTALAYSSSFKFLAALDNFNNVPPKNVRLYNVADLEIGPQLRDLKLFQSGNGSIEWNGELDFGGNYLFALDQNNGIQAFKIDTSYVAPGSSFKILAVASASGAVTLQWEARNGGTYQIQYVNSLTDTWTNLGSPVTATGTTASYVDAVPNGVTQRFYRILAN
jgi:hypothetical protein